MKRAEEFLKTQEFVNVGTADRQAQPNVAPKFLLKVKPHELYIVDYIMGRTYENLKINPRVSLSVIDMETLVGYRINGKVEMIEKGPVYQSLMKELRIKEVKLSARRILDGVMKEREPRHKSYEVAFPDVFVIFKVTIKSILKICPSGKLKRERILPRRQ